MVSALEGLQQAFAGKKVFITGHTGFKGAWMLKWLHMLGAEIKGYALAPESPEGVYTQIKGDKLCTSIIADIRDKDRVAKEVLSFGPDFIFHLAAQPLVRLSYELPEETFEINGLGTAYLLRSVRLLEKPCTVLVITTDKVYENKEWVHPYRENDQLGGYDPYSASKSVAELIAASYIRSFFSVQKIAEHKKVIGIARAGNVIGGGDWAVDRIVPDIIRALRENRPIEIRNPLSVRPWQHVLEPIGAYLLLAQAMVEQKSMSGEAWNVGPLAEDQRTVLELVQKALQIWGGGKYNTAQNNNAVHEAHLLRLDISKIMSRLKWMPKLNSAEAIKWTIQWYKDGVADPARYTENQIREYISR